ncbi:MAG: hypothetical protein U5M51_06710 [Emticicia sp.]|nr:hypothetical protein [Emticicia sp.]
MIYQSRKERTFVTKQALARLNAQNNNASNRETNILSSIPIIAKSIRIGCGFVKVYYLSDMVEECKKRSRFSDKTPKK